MLTNNSIILSIILICNFKVCFKSKTHTNMDSSIQGKMLIKDMVYVDSHDVNPEKSIC